MQGFLLNLLRNKGVSDKGENREITSGLSISRPNSTLSAPCLPFLTQGNKFDEKRNGYRFMREG